MDKYIRAAQALGEHHGLVVVVFDKHAPFIVFKVFLHAEEKLIPLEAWTVHTVDTPPVIASEEYLKLPAEHINRADQAEFDAIIEML